MYCKNNKKHRKGYVKYKYFMWDCFGQHLLTKFIKYTKGGYTSNWKWNVKKRGDAITSWSLG